MCPYSIVHPLYFSLGITESYRVIKLKPLTLPQNRSFPNVPAQQNRSVTDPSKHYRTARFSFRAYYSTESFCAAPLKTLPHGTITVPYCILPRRTVLCAFLKHYCTARLSFYIAPCPAEPFYVAPPKTLPHGTIAVLHCKVIRQIMSLNVPNALHGNVMFSDRVLRTRG